MTLTATCPACHRPQPAGWVCAACCDHLERNLADVPAILDDLDTALARQARITDPGRGGLASEQTPWNQTASIAAGALTNTLTTWARDLTNNQWRPPAGQHPARAAAHYLLAHITHIRTHPAAGDLVDEITSGIRQARHTTDRKGRAFHVGPCPETPCPGEVWAHLPADDRRPATMTCRADNTHTWGSAQMLRAGIRIRRIIDTKQGA